MLRIANLTKRFGGITAVEDLSLSIERSEIVGIIGPNGAGKTTLINLIMGVYRATFGEIWFCEKKISKMTTYKIARLGLTRTFQVVKPILGLTVLESVISSTIFGNKEKFNMQQARNRAEEIINYVSLSSKKNYQTSQLNVVDLKKLDLAKALSMNPELILLDEVMAGLNTKEIGEMMGFITKICSDGITLLVVEHVMKAVMGISNRIVVIHNGRKLSEGTPEEVSSDPAVIKVYLGKKYDFI
jgi:branched-chain amino acid transport system ATP-binding protein